MTVGWTLLPWLLLGAAEPPQAQHPPVSQRFHLSAPARQIQLPRRLDEVSGLTFTHDGRLLAHDDERGVVYTVDPQSGAVDRGFQLGSPVVRDDMEGAASAGERLFLISSRGLLYEFRAVGEGETSPVRITDTRLGASCEAEGLVYHRASNSLLVACKTLTPPSDEVRIHFVPLDADAPAPPPLRIPLDALSPWGHRGPLNPSGVEVDPRTGTLLVVAARQERLLEVDLTGRVLDLVALPREHRQPEGIAIGPDGRLWIADEAGTGRAYLRAYAPRKGDPR